MADEIVDLSNGNGCTEICSCPCHQNPFIMHVLACCQKCENCGQNINYQAYKAHKKACQAKKVKSIPQPSLTNEAELSEEIVIAL